jgi:uncharacterized membrane protein
MDIFLWYVAIGFVSLIVTTVWVKTDSRIDDYFPTSIAQVLSFSFWWIVIPVEIIALLVWFVNRLVDRVIGAIEKVKADKKAAADAIAKEAARVAKEAFNKDEKNFSRSEETNFTTKPRIKDYGSGYRIAR